MFDKLEYAPTEVLGLVMLGGVVVALIVILILLRDYDAFWGD